MNDDDKTGTMTRRRKARSGRRDGACKGPRAEEGMTYWRNSLAANGFGREPARKCMVPRGLKRSACAAL